MAVLLPKKESEACVAGKKPGYQGDKYRLYPNPTNPEYAHSLSPEYKANRRFFSMLSGIRLKAPKGKNYFSADRDFKIGDIYVQNKNIKSLEQAITQKQKILLYISPTLSGAGDDDAPVSIDNRTIKPITNYIARSKMQYIVVPVSSIQELQKSILIFKNNKIKVDDISVAIHGAVIDGSDYFLANQQDKISSMLKRFVRGKETFSYDPKTKIQTGFPYSLRLNLYDSFEGVRFDKEGLYSKLIKVNGAENISIRHCITANDIQSPTDKKSQKLLNDFELAVQSKEGARVIAAPSVDTSTLCYDSEIIVHWKILSLKDQFIKNDRMISDKRDKAPSLALGNTNILSPR